MRILYCGNFLPRHSTESHVRLSLESLGHFVEPMQENAQTADTILERVRSSKPDILLWTRTWRMTGDLVCMLKECESMGVPTVAYHLDLYAPIERGRSGGHEGKGIGSDPWWGCKYVFSPDGDPGSAKFFAEHRVNHHYLPPAVYHAECEMAPAEPGAGADVLFVGSYHYHAEWPYRQQLIEWLRATYSARFRLVPGPGEDAIRNEALNRLYASSKVVVGDSLVPGFTHENYTSDRLFETLGRGGFLVYPRIKGITDGALVTEGEHVAAYSFGDFDGLKRTIDYYLDNATERERIRRAGHEHVKANHTYRHRLTDLLAIVGASEGWA